GAEGEAGAAHGWLAGLVLADGDHVRGSGAIPIRAAGGGGDALPIARLLPLAASRARDARVVGAHLRPGRAHGGLAGVVQTSGDRVRRRRAFAVHATGGGGHALAAAAHLLAGAAGVAGDADVPCAGL